MSYQKPVVKSKIHNSDKVLSTSDKSQLEGKVADAKRIETEKRQDEIDYYNYHTCATIDPEFSNLQLSGKQIVVRLHKENYIKAVDVIGEAKTPLYDAWISQVDGRQRQVDPAKWVENPLPYIFMGTVVAMSPLARAEYLAEKDAVAKVDPVGASKFKALEVGDVVHLTHFMFADKRFYLNKQERDFIKNPNEYRIEHWEGYVLIHPTMIEAIELNMDNAQRVYSPYISYKAWLDNGKEGN
jgi:hypothetical protein